MANTTLFAYVNISNPMVQWEVAVGRMRSACDRATEGFTISLWQYTLLRNYARTAKTARFVDELRLEAIRRSHYPCKVSRLKGLYFFETAAEAEHALQYWKPRRQGVEVCQINFSATNLTRVDSEWITHCLGKVAGTDWMHSYWNGEAYDKTPLTEVLGSGIGVVANPSLRKTAYEGICTETPLTSKILAFSAAAFHCGHEQVGDVVPALVADGNIVRGSYYIDMRAFRGEFGIDFGKCFERCANEGAVFPYARECDASETLQLRATQGSFDLHLSDREMAEFAEILG